MAETPEPTDDEVEPRDQMAAEKGRSFDDDARFRAVVASIVGRDRELLDRLAR